MAHLVAPMASEVLLKVKKVRRLTLVLSFFV